MQPLRRSEFIRTVPAQVTPFLEPAIHLFRTFFLLPHSGTPMLESIVKRHCCPRVLSTLALLGSLIAVAGNDLKDKQHTDFNYGQAVAPDAWVQSIVVTCPDYRSQVQGNVTVAFKAPGMSSANAFCWRQPTTENPSRWGHDACLTPQGIRLKADGSGTFVFPADNFPYGPVNVRILAHNQQGQRDICELQLYNTGGVRWNQGIPDTDPPAAQGMKLVFDDDFDEPLSISKDGRGARYNAHKPRFGDFSGWPFSDPAGPNNPFEQIDTYLRIKARKPEGTKGFTGLIASVDMDGKGFCATVPAYFECRFVAQSAAGTWPAFWTLTRSGLDRRTPADELDIVEAYGGVGAGNPNHPGYEIVSHFWRQTHPDGAEKKNVTRRVPIMELGGRSYWSTTFHTYAVKIGLDDTVYYFDDIEVLRHPTNDLSKNEPHFFLANLAIGGISGWPINLERYGNGSDMYLDYIRVYQGE
jgi:hypothetical protein